VPFPRPSGGGVTLPLDHDDPAEVVNVSHSIIAAEHTGFPGGGTTFLRDDGVFAAPPGGGGAPADADYLVGTAHAGLSAEIVVGVTPGGELGGTWAAPTVDAVHSGSAHHAEVHAIDGANHTGTLLDAQIPAAIARDAEVTAAVAAHAAIEQAHDLEHADLFAIGIDDHHARDHALSGANHSGSISDAQHGARGPIVGAHGHDDLDTVTADQHHAQVHDIDGANHDGFPGGTSTFLRADGTFAAPTAAAADPVYSPGSFTVVTETGRYIPKRLNVAGAERVNVEGTGRLVIN
jgi:hypothetical protein